MTVLLNESMRYGGHHNDEMHVLDGDDAEVREFHIVKSIRKEQVQRVRRILPDETHFSAKMNGQEFGKEEIAQRDVLHTLLTISPNNPSLAHELARKEKPKQEHEYHGTRESIKAPTAPKYVEQQREFYFCPDDNCKKGPFKTLYDLKSHVDVHNQQKIFYCDYAGCPKAKGGSDPGFKRNSELKRHQHKHEGKKFVCPLCNNGHDYKRGDNLTRHVNTAHKNSVPVEGQEKLQEVLAQASSKNKLRKSRKQQHRSRASVSSVGTGTDGSALAGAAGDAAAPAMTSSNSSPSTTVTPPKAEQS